VFFFFFQAEDGIRDRNVTGVQTCALPIYDERCCRPARGRGPRRDRDRLRRAPRARLARARGGQARPRRTAARLQSTRGGGSRARSEERRVGKEGRSWWAAS